jgi:predicted ATPase/DNA-binding winged helix-turn-helix (wHTH) protein
MSTLHFHGFCILPGERRVTVKQKTVKLSARAFDLLMVLVNGRDRVIRKDELLDAVWPGVAVEENNLQVQISSLRKHLGAMAIATVPGRGYQFTAQSIDPSSPDGAAAGAGAASPSDTPVDDTVARETRVGNIAQVLPSLYGRDTELDEVWELLAGARLLTITGAGGIGKARLALAAGKRMAAQAPHGIWMVELAPLSDPQMVVSEIAQTMGVSLNSGEPQTQLLVDALADQNLMLILDNCEHLLEAVADVATELLAQLPQLRILVTSQELLKLENERVFRLNPLSLPQATGVTTLQTSGAIQLLVPRVQAVQRQFQLTAENTPAAIDICRHLDGVPLAIELAAARIPMLGITGVHQRLGELFRLLTGDARVRLRRHQTLRATLDWSYQLLDAGEQTLLCRLGVFAGGFSIEGAQLIANDLFEDDWQTLETLAALVDKSLVQVNAQQVPRYSLLETTRAYAMEQLALESQTDVGLARHARTTRLVCERAAKRRNMDLIWQEMANVRAAFNWAIKSPQDNETAVALATISSVVLAVGGLVGEALDRLLKVEPIVGPALPVELAAQYWQWLGRCGIDGRLPTSRCLAAFEKAEALFRGLSNRRHVHACMRMRAEALLELGDLGAARLALNDAFAMEQSGWAVADRMRRLRVQGLVHAAASDYTEGLALIGKALDMAVANDIDRYALTLANDQASIRLSMGDAVAAEAGFRSLIAQGELGPEQGLTLSYARIRLAVALLMQAKVDAGCAMAQESIQPLQRSGILIARGDLFGWILVVRGHYKEACTMLGAAQAFRDQRQLEADATERRARAETLKAITGNLDAATISERMADAAALQESAFANILFMTLRTPHKRGTVSTR